MALVLPLAAYFALFFAAPLAVLVGVSLFAEPTMRTLSLAQYGRFLGDRLHLSILGDTLLLGVKATLVCLVFGYPLAHEGEAERASEILGGAIQPGDEVRVGYDIANDSVTFEVEDRIEIDLDEASSEPARIT